MLKHFLRGLVILVLGIGLAHAGWNLRQNADGTTDWVRGPIVGEEHSIAIGEHYLTVQFENVSTAATVAVAIPITNVRISRISSVILGNIATADATFAFFLTSDDTGTILEEVTNTTAPITITQSGDETGDVDVFTPTAENTTQRDRVLFIHGEGESTNDIDAMFTITLVPR